MRATTIICVILGVWICGAYCSMQMEEDNAVEFSPEEYHDASLAHHRVRRSPLDPIVAPLLIGKSFLYGALVGPKLFKPHFYPRYYHHHYPVHHYGHHYGHGHGHGHGGYGYGGYGGYGYGR